jgi:NADH-quinone oxidoreductase subunit N
MKLLAVASQATDLEQIPRPGVDWVALAPLLVLVGAGLVLMLIVTFLRKGAPLGVYTGLTCLAALGTIGAAVPLWFRVQDADEPSASLNDAIVVDGFAVFAIVVLAVAVLLSALFMDGYLRREGIAGLEAYVLLLFSAAGGVVMAQANDLIVLFLGLEVLSIAVYVLAALHARRIKSQEAGMKYLVLGAFSSAFLLYGIALIYGATGTTNLAGIQDYFATNVPTSEGLVLGGMALLLVGLGFKVAAVPFHSWTPDVYQGSPTPMVAWMASGVKLAGFAGLIRVFVEAFDSRAVDWQPLIYALAAATLVVGSFMAVVQTDVKRMLAYSSISHAGFILVAVQANTDQGVQAALIYLGAYTFMVAGSFGLVAVLGRTGDSRHALDDYRGLGQKQPLVALVLTLFLLSQAGVPFTAGFWAKFYAVTAAVDAGSWTLAAIAMLAAAVAAFLYLRIVVSMFMSDTEDAAPGLRGLRVPVLAKVATAVCVVVTLGVGFFPGPVVDTAGDAVGRLVTEQGTPQDGFAVMP